MNYKLTHRCRQQDGHIIVWDIDSLGMVCEFEDHIETIKALAFCPDGRRIVACAADKCLKVLDIDLGAAVISFETEDELNCLATDGTHWHDVLFLPG